MRSHDTLDFTGVIFLDKIEKLRLKALAEKKEKAKAKKKAKEEKKETPKAE